MSNFDDPGSINKPSLIPKDEASLIPKDIIASFLKIIQGAWIHVCKRGDITINSDEPTIAGALEYEMWKEKERQGIYGPPQIVNESAERQSELSLKPDGFIDFKMFYGWDKQDYFGIECKRVSSITTGKDEKLATRYITQGLIKFIKGIYCKNHNFAAMLGFIIDGKPEKCVTKVQQRMNKLSKKINLEENWDKEERFGKHSHLYRTCHRQVDHNNNLITILHLFVDFNPL